MDINGICFFTSYHCFDRPVNVQHMKQSPIYRGRMWCSNPVGDGNLENTYEMRRDRSSMHQRETRKFALAYCTALPGVPSVSGRALDPLWISFWFRLRSCSRSGPRTLSPPPKMPNKCMRPAGRCHGRRRRGEEVIQSERSLTCGWQTHSTEPGPVNPDLSRH